MKTTLSANSSTELIDSILATEEGQSVIFFALDGIQYYRFDSIRTNDPMIRI